MRAGDVRRLFVRALLLFQFASPALPETHRGLRFERTNADGSPEVVQPEVDYYRH